MRMALRSVPALVVILAATAALGQTAAPQRPALLNDVLACRAITSEAERLACFDRSAAAFEAAEAQGEVTVVDRAQARETRRRLFGLDLGGAALFGGLREEAPVSAIETTLTAARPSGREQWTFQLADGSTWRQVDTEPLNRRPTPGLPVRIRQAALGSYMLSLDGARSVRVRRER